MSACGVDHQSKRRDMKIKSTFNISFQIHFVCFVLNIFIVSWILLVVAFNLLTPWCSFLQKGRLMKLCDGDCTIKKRNRQQCFILKHILCFIIQGILLSLSVPGIRKAQVQASYWVTLRHCLIMAHVIINTLFVSITPFPPKMRWYKGLSVLITQWVNTLHFNRATDTMLTQRSGGYISTAVSSVLACVRINV